MLTGRMILGAFMAAAFAGAVSAAPPAQKGPLPDWPCPEPRQDALSPAAVYAAPLPAALPRAEAWEQDAAVRDVVVFAAAPENNPELGGARIKAYAGTLGAERQAGLMLVLSGIVERTNMLRRIIIDGIGETVVKSRLLAETVAKNESELAAVASDGTAAAAERKKALETARYWNARALGDTADDAELLCHRLAYSAKKAVLLAAAVRSALERP